jgi:hypothetical protein
MKRKAGRPRLGKQNKVHVSIRLEPKVRAKLIADHGSVQKWIDSMIGSLCWTAIPDKNVKD